MYLLQQNIVPCVPGVVCFANSAVCTVHYNFWTPDADFTALHCMLHAKISFPMMEKGFYPGYWSSSSSSNSSLCQKLLLFRF